MPTTVTWLPTIIEPEKVVLELVLTVIPPHVESVKINGLPFASNVSVNVVRLAVGVGVGIGDGVWVGVGEGGGVWLGTGEGVRIGVADGVGEGDGEGVGGGVGPVTDTVDVKA